ncbi:MAG: D-alanine--D-alanine ligase family protein [Ilumatobacteraceae bacterium]
MAADAIPSATAGSDNASPADGRINLIVLFGGQSAEHDVSCTTAAHVLRAADPAKYRITPIGISRDGTWAVATGALMALAEGPHTLPGRLDPAGDAVAPTAALSPAATGLPVAAGRTVVVPLLHGPLGEDGTVQGMLELANVPYVGTGVLGSAVAMDKAMAKQVTAVHGIPQARYVALRAHEVTPGTAAHVAAELGLPVFVKPANMGSSVGVTKAKTVEAVRDAIEVALSYDEWIVIEEAIDGREIEVAVLGNLEPKASVPGEIVPGAEFYDYADKYVDDGSQSLIPAPLTPEQTAEVQQLAIRSFAALRCEGLSRVDFFFEEHGRGFLLNEINTMPGFTPISMYPKLWIASGLSYRDLIDELVRLALERHSRQRRNTSH